MAITIRSEKGSFITISEGDENFIELRNVIDNVNILSSTISSLVNEYNNNESIFNTINQDYLDYRQNLADVESAEITRENLNVYSNFKTGGMEDTFFNTAYSLTDVSPPETRDNLGIGTNALRDITFYEDVTSETPISTEGVNGDLWHNLGIYDGVVSFGYSADPSSMKISNFNLNNGNLIRTYDNSNSYRKMLYANNYIYALTLSGDDTLIEIDKDNLQNKKTLFNDVIDFDVSYYDTGNTINDGYKREIVGVKSNNVVFYVDKYNNTVERTIGIDVQSNGETIEKIMVNKNTDTIFFMSQNRGGIIDMNQSAGNEIIYNRVLNQPIGGLSDPCFIGNDVFYVVDFPYQDVIKFNPVNDTSELYFAVQDAQTDETFSFLSVDFNDNLYVGTEDYVYKIEEDQQGVKTISNTVVDGAGPVDMKASVDGFMYVLSYSAGVSIVSKYELEPNLSITYQYEINDYTLPSSLGIYPGKYESGFMDRFI